MLGEDESDDVWAEDEGEKSGETEGERRAGSFKAVLSGLGCLVRSWQVSFHILAPNVRISFSRGFA